MKVMSVFGTRPEAIKMCPLILELEKYPEIESIVCLTGQHRQMLDQVMGIFGVHAQYDLDIMRPAQTLVQITSRVLEGFTEVLKREQPQLVLVHGDTSTSFPAALASFYQQIPVGHVEAGLRTYDRYSPFPEEMNRCLTARITELHFAPTEKNKKNLEKESVAGEIYVTGNTIIDALHQTVQKDYLFKDRILRQISRTDRKCILVTAHRRENLGLPLENICRAVRYLADTYPDMDFVYPVHLNPAVQAVAEHILRGQKNVYLLPPADVEDMHNLISRSYLVLTDSGGLQEEAPACGVPVLVLRTETERPEAVEAGTVRIAGIEEKQIITEAAKLIEDPAEYEKMAYAVNPYGDGKACERIAARILDWKERRCCHV